MVTNVSRLNGISHGDTPSAGDASREHETPVDAGPRTSTSRFEETPIGHQRPTNPRASTLRSSRPARPNPKALLVLGTLAGAAAARSMGPGASDASHDLLPRALANDPASSSLNRGILDQLMAPQCPASFQAPEHAATASAGKLQADAIFAPTSSPSQILLPGRVAADAPPDAAPYRDIAPLIEHYRGEETGVVWGTKVRYLDDEQRVPFKVSIKDGILRDAAGQLFDTQAARTAHGGSGRAIFVMSHDGDIYVSNSHQPGHFHHSSFLGGKPVAAAGEIEVHRGEVKLINRMSGHYRPTADQLNQFATQLRLHGAHHFETRLGLDTGARRGTMQWLQNTILVLGAGGVIAANLATPIRRMQLDRKLASLSPDALKLARIAVLQRFRFNPETAKTMIGCDDARLDTLTHELAVVGLFDESFSANDFTAHHIEQSIPEQELQALDSELQRLRLS